MLFFVSIYQELTPNQPFFKFGLQHFYLLKNYLTKNWIILINQNHPCISTKVRLRSDLIIILKFQPCPHEQGGKYGQGVIVRRYNPGSGFF
jgi:hypothetical protein